MKGVSIMFVKMIRNKWKFEYDKMSVKVMKVDNIPSTYQQMAIFHFPKGI